MGCRAGAVVIAAAVAACDPGLDVPFAEKLAVGTTKRIDVQGDCIGTNCVGVPITEIVEVVIERDSVLTATVIDADTFTLTAHKVGESLATVVAVDAERELRKEELDVEAFLIKRLEFLPRDCEHDADVAAETTFVPADQPITFTWTMFGEGDVPLEGDITFDAPGLMQTLLDQDLREIAFRTPAQLGVHSISSSVWPAGPVHTVEVYGIERFDGLEVDVVFPSMSSVSSTPVDVRPKIGEHVPCMEDVERTLRVLTPAVCSLDNELNVEMATTREVRWRIYGRAVGMCQVEVGLTGTTLKGMAQVDFTGAGM
jgi:hypothetical protein